MLDLSLEGGGTLKGYKVNCVRSISGGRGGTLKGYKVNCVRSISGGRGGDSERIQGELG